MRPGWPSRSERFFFIMGVVAWAAAVGQGTPKTPGKQEIKLAFEAQAMVASGLTPGEKVAWFSVAREATGFGSRVVRREWVILVDDKDGIARVELDQPVPPRSIWAAVDLKSGDYELGTPGDYPLRQAQLPPGSVLPGASGKLDRLFAGGRDLVDFFVARPAVGAWALTVWDGAGDDEDGPSNRQISSAFAKMEPAGEGPPPPDELKPGDVVIVMDPNAMEVMAARLSGGTP